MPEANTLGCEATMSVTLSLQVVIERCHFDDLLHAIEESGYRVIGPTVRDGAIIYDNIHTSSDLPVGWTDLQEGGSYRLEPRGDAALFGYTVGPHSWKRYLFPPTLRLWSAQRNGGDFNLLAEEQDTPKLALLGVRACEVHAMQIQDRVFMGGSSIDPTYAQRRAASLIVAVNCGRAGGTCFCVSTNTGPRVDTGYDLTLTEILEGDRHYFVVDVGTPAGAEIVARVPHRQASAENEAAADAVVARTAGQMGRTLETDGLKELLYRNYDHPRWDDVASRCLSCANCTMVCPTCFCSTVEDTTDLSGQEAERVRRWDSCFTVDFSYIHGGSVRPSPRSRYRQWMTHKLASWIDQFGTTGCVGCGRCITWCPVGIDITAETRAIRTTDGASAHAQKEEVHGHS
jgi:sulfhydrogenase subunit beta (sulfur reductase)